MEKKIRALEEKHNKRDSAQKTIPYLEMYRDGVCHVSDDYYSKTIQFFDINYQLAQDSDKIAIFQKFCDVHNYFDSGLDISFSYINQVVDSDDYKSSIFISSQEDDFNDIREEFVDMLKSQLEKGNNGLERLKYLTIGLHEKNRKTAKSRLEHVETEIIGCFKQMGVAARSLDGYDRLKSLHRTFNPDNSEEFIFDWKQRGTSGLSTKDFIAPSSFVFNKRNSFQMGGMYGSTWFIDIIASEINDRMLTEYLNLENNIIVNIQLKSWEQTQAIKFIKKKMTAINAMKIDEQKKAARAGYDIDVLPPDLKTYSDSVQSLLDELQSRNERFFNTKVTITAFAPTKKKLDLIIGQIKNITQKNNCKLCSLDYQQEDAFMSALPIGVNRLRRSRELTTGAVSVFIPFTTQELFQSAKSCEPIYYGCNALSGNLIMADRKQLKNPNGLLLGTPGSGKSFTAKREISNAFLVTTDDIIICDPEGEYYPLVNALHGQRIKISSTSHDHINPMDISSDYSEDDDPITLKSDFILSLCELVVGGKYGLQADERSIIDRCVKTVYTEYFKNPIPENMPILEDLYNALRKTDTEPANHVANALELYVTGSLNLFNHRTNVDITNRLVCFDIKELQKNLRKIGMLVVQDQVWNRVTINRSEKKSTRYYIDEFHLLLKEEQTANYSVEIWKRFRKWGGIPTGMTQNVKDLLTSKEIENILDNSDFICMLNQAAGDREILAQKLGISDDQLGYVTNSNQGEGLLFYGDVILPFVDRFPKDTKLYSVMTTKLEEQTQSDL
ncbi:MAG: ATP-binding protein [Eubacterium sp.]|nr:ATP-binding protein [Eubacterium sp.]